MSEVSSARTSASIVSGYFNPLHLGHLALMEAAQEITGYLIVIVNNDAQQIAKKGRAIAPKTSGPPSCARFVWSTTPSSRSTRTTA